MARYTPRQKRALGLWTAAWLFVLLLAGVLRLGELPVQWPVLLVPVLWALVALRPRRGSRAPVDGYREPPEPQWPEAGSRRSAPPTRELPRLPDVPHRPWQE